MATGPGIDARLPREATTRSGRGSGDYDASLYPGAFAAPAGSSRRERWLNRFPAFDDGRVPNVTGVIPPPDAEDDMSRKAGRSFTDRPVFRSGLAFGRLGGVRAGLFVVRRELIGPGGVASAKGSPCTRTISPSPEIWQPHGSRAASSAWNEVITGVPLGFGRTRSSASRPLY